MSNPPGAGETIKWPSRGAQGREPGALPAPGRGADRGVSTADSGRVPRFSDLRLCRLGELIFGERAEEIGDPGEGWGGFCLNLLLPEPRSDCTPCHPTGDPGGRWAVPLLCPGGASLSSTPLARLGPGCSLYLPFVPQEALPGGLLRSQVEARGWTE